MLPAAGICLPSSADRPVKHEAKFPDRQSRLVKEEGGCQCLTWITGWDRSLQGQAGVHSEGVCLRYPDGLPLRVSKVNPIMKTCRCFSQAHGTGELEEGIHRFEEGRVTLVQGLWAREQSGSNAPLPCLTHRCHCQQIEQTQLGMWIPRRVFFGCCQPPRWNAKLSFVNSLSGCVTPWAHWAMRLSFPYKTFLWNFLVQASLSQHVGFTNPCQGWVWHRYKCSFFPKALRATSLQNSG